ncbi:KAP family P-loop NTPase fold protein [Ferrimonas balearica]|uniref:KAP family P-loop NTPase fold protein n=1 Tax=Ferrimonas balearica TaxID=44012 RepID=UPI001C97C6A0|nr:P-loop NTPase fold protein [Ferrimonas balearica]MBY6223548.1 KAP family NTPase [Ferrimonas balearica]
MRPEERKEENIETVAGFYHDWELLPNGQRRTFDNCALNRKAYGEFLINYLNGEGENGYVLNLNGEWGAGKTEFVRRLYAELRDRNHPVVFINAWTSDFAKDPLMVVGCELLEQLKYCTNDFNNPEDDDEIRAVWTRVKNGTIATAALLGRVGLGVATSGASEAVGAGEAVKTLAEMAKSEQPSPLAEGFISHYRDQRNSIQQVRTYLEQLAERFKAHGQYQTPIYVIVDELDRCRPDYAIELLETIKHFFAVPGAVFVVSTNIEQLQHSVKATYGDDFDSEAYLRRFFDRRVALQEASVIQYLHSKQPEIPFLDDSRCHWGGVSCPEDFYRMVDIVALAFKLRLRDVDQIVSRVQACLRHIQSHSLEKEQCIYVLGLLFVLAEQHTSIRVRAKENNGCLVNSVLSEESINWDGDYSGLLSLAVKAMSIYQIDTNRGRYIDGRPVKIYRDGALPVSAPEEGDHYREFSLLKDMLSLADKFIENGTGVYWDINRIEPLVEMAGYIE